ncbi:MAG: hypothetical protein GY929_20615, partial [Actinomycetia bacterium]|nr:hypothetical protein [Actinomycetes bacterium]
NMTVNQRVFGYVACISAIYAALESFAEDLAFRYAELATRHDGLISEESEAKLRSRYSHNVAHLLTQQLGVGRYERVTQLDLAKSLASLLDEASVSSLRPEAVGHHKANLRLPSLVELFQWGASDLTDRLGKSDALKRWGDSVGRDSGLDSLIRTELEDLVERRNAVAHRALTDEIVSHDQLRAKVEFIDALSLGLLACLGTQILDLLVARIAASPVGPISERHQSGEVLVVENAETALAVGDLVLARNQTTSRWGQIMELQLDDEPASSSDVGSEVGIRLDFRCHKNAALFLVRGVPGELLSPPARLFGDHGPISADG